MEIRKSIGERMLERLDRSDRFSRYARLQSGFKLGSYLFPDEVTARPDRVGEDDLTHLSSAPYWARMSRLGNARLRRQQRLAALSARSARFGQVSAARRLPDAKVRAFPFFGLPSVMSDGFEVLAPLPAPVEPGEADSLVRPSEPSAQRAWVGAQRAQSPWLSRDHRPARVAERNEKIRPLERAADRAPAPKRAVERVREFVTAGSTSSGRSVASSSSQSGSGDVAPRADRNARRARQALRRRASPTQMVSVDYEAALPDDFLPPSRHAQGRIASSRSGRRGLRSALSSSPLMAALEPAVGSSTAAGTPSVAPSKRATGSSIGQTASRRVAHRQQQPTRELLSTSPVRSPATVAPSALEAPVSRPVRSQTTPVQGSVDGQVPQVQAAPMVRALHRAESFSQPVVERPLSSRSPVAARPVKTRSGIFAPETSVLTPGVVPEEVTADAEPEVAEARSARRTQAANAALRSIRGSERESVLEPSSVEPATARAVRPHRVARTEAGVYVPQAKVLAPVMEPVIAPDAASAPAAPPAETIAARASRPVLGASVVTERIDAEPSRAAPLAAERLNAAPMRGARDRNRNRNLGTSVSMADAEVLAPMPSPVEPQELPQGQHAAGRATRASVVGETARKALGVEPARRQRQAPKSTGSVAEQRRSDQPVSGSSMRSVAPKRFRSPLSHIQVQRPVASGRSDARPGRSQSPAERITLAASAEHSVDSGAGLREARQAALGQVQEAWSRSGRPLDWTSARIEVIQVQAPASVNTSEPARAQRTVTGAYVPAVSRRDAASRRPSMAPAAMDSATVLTPGSTQGVAAPVAEDRAAAAPIDSMDPTVNEPMGRSRSPRTGFDSTMGGVGAGQVNPSMPIWAQRSTGRPRIAGGDDLVSQLARATAPEEVVSVLMDQGDAVRRATSSLPTPVVQVIQQIKTEAVRAEGEAQVAERAALETETVRQRSRRREGVRSTTRVARGMTGLSPGSGSARAPSAAMDRVSKLAKRLQDLIAMAENQNRGGARQEVRMAEDSGAARAEGQSAPAAAEEARDASADIDTLAREVTEQVTRELEMRRERRQEDPDGRSIWW